MIEKFLTIQLSEQKETQKAIRKAGVTGETVDMLRIDEYEENGGITAGTKVGAAKKSKKTILLPITESLKDGLNKVSAGYKISTGVKVYQSYQVITFKLSFEVQFAFVCIITSISVQTAT